MRPAILTILIALFVAAACDKPTAPAPIDLVVAPRDTTVDARTSFSLRAHIEGGRPQDAAIPSWKSLDPGVATVDDGGFVIAYHPGTARVVATVGTASDTATIRVERTLMGLRVAENILYLSPGDSATATAVAIDTDEVPMPEIVISWRSESPEVATVTPAGSVRAVAYGWATLRGEAEGAQATVTVGVFPPRSGECDSVGAQIRLQAGETRVFTGQAAHRLCLSATSGDHEILVFNENPPGSSVDLTALVPWVHPVAPQESQLDPAARAAKAPAPRAHARSPLMKQLPVRDAGFEHRLRRREARELQPRLRPRPGSRSMAAALAPAASVEPTLGKLLQLRTGTTCDAHTERTAIVSAIGRHTLIVTDTTNPRGGLTQVGYEELAMAFDTLLYPVTTSTFGEPTDLDGNGRVLVFITRAVNELTSEDSAAYVGGYHWAGDLFPAAECASSNAAEILYVLAPDPTGSINGQRWSAETIQEITARTIAHELQHLINASRRLYVNDAAEWETVWLNEGLSHIAEELVFYRSSGMSPRVNISADAILADPVRTRAFNLYGGSNLARYSYFLEDLPNQSPFQDDDDLATRGAIWSFLRYAADHSPRPEREIWYELGNSAVGGLPNLEAALGTDLDLLRRRWLISNLRDDQPLVAPEHTQPSWASGALLAAMGIPVTAPRIWAIPGAHTVPVASSSMNVLRFQANGEIRFERSGGPPPAGLRVEVTRSR